MNSKGAVELAIAYVALHIGILTLDLYSALVMTALVTTILFQIIIVRMVKKDPKIILYVLRNQSKVDQKFPPLSS